MSRIPQSELDAIVLALGSTDGMETRTLLWKLRGFVYGEVPRAQYRREYQRLRRRLMVLWRQGLVWSGGPEGPGNWYWDGYYWWGLKDAGLEHLEKLKEAMRL